MAIVIGYEGMPRSCDVCRFSKTNDDLFSEDYRYRYCDFPGIGEYVTDYEATRHPYCPLIKELPVNIGDTLYFAGYDENFPDESNVEEHKVTDVSVNGLVRIDDGEWIDLNSDGCWMFKTRQEAIDQIVKLGGDVEE